MDTVIFICYGFLNSKVYKLIYEWDTKNIETDMVKTILYVLKPQNYFESVIDIFKSEIKEHSIIYVTMSKPYSHILNLFKEAKLNTDNIFFIDCISAQVLKSTKKTPPKCIFVESPQNITAIGIAISESVAQLTGEKLLFVDSLSTLLMYNEAKVVGKFSNFIINKMRAEDVNTSIFALESDADKDTIKTIETFVDQVIQK